MKTNRFFCLILPVFLLAACGDSSPPDRTSGSASASSAGSTSSAGGTGGSEGTGGTGGNGGTGGAGGSESTGGAGGEGGSSQALYHNPVLRGDFADPSIIRVGNEYWASATSSEWGPPFPLLQSTDLVNWKQVGTVFADVPDWAFGKFWAPEIQEDNGQFYIFYTAHKKNGPLCVGSASANSPSGPFTDNGPLVCQDVGSIDGFSIRDENGKRHLIWKEDGNSVGAPTKIWAQELSDDGKQLLGQAPVALFQNDPSWEANLVEGPFILRRDDAYYAFYSGAGCCGKDCSYALGVARSKNLLGPWEKSPKNPILIGNGTWKCPGHGSIVTTEDGRYYMLYHAYSVKDGVYVGRQGVLDEVVFGADGWPTINGGAGPSVSAPVPIAPQSPPPAEFFDDFTSAALAPGWQWPVAAKPETSLDAANGGELVLQAIQEGPGNHTGAAIARSTRSGDYVATTDVKADPGVRAGLTAFGDIENALGISVLDGKIIVWRLGNGMSQSLSQEDAPAGVTWLRMTAAKGHLYSFAVSADGGQSWQPQGGLVDSHATDPDLPPWDRGVRVALVASGPSGAAARFGSLRIAETP
jgi:xylan 1,4-beta-xylosidase